MLEALKEAKSEIVEIKLKFNEILRDIEQNDYRYKIDAIYLRSLDLNELHSLQ